MQSAQVPVEAVQVPWEAAQVPVRSVQEPLEAAQGPVGAVRLLGEVKSSVLGGFSPPPKRQRAAGLEGSSVRLFVQSHAVQDVGSQHPLAQVSPAVRRQLKLGVLPSAFAGGEGPPLSGQGAVSVCESFGLAPSRKRRRLLAPLGAASGAGPRAEAPPLVRRQLKLGELPGFFRQAAVGETAPGLGATAAGPPAG